MLLYKGGWKCKIKKKITNILYIIDYYIREAESSRLKKNSHNSYIIHSYIREAEIQDRKNLISHTLCIII